MPIEEYNKSFKHMKKLKEYKLEVSEIIIHYNVSSDQVMDTPKPHGNSKNINTTFRPTMHSVKQACKEKLVEDNSPARYIIDYIYIQCHRKCIHERN